MFLAVCSRDKNKKTITADEAYSKVFREDDWGFFQARDGWVCPECEEPVFLKPPHERYAKEYSYVVQAHFCHHSTKAAAQCALYKAASHQGGLGESERIHADRKQSLKRFLTAYPQQADYISELLGIEEEYLRNAAKGVLAKQVTSYRQADGILKSDPIGQVRAAQTHYRLQQLDNFLAGVLSLGLGSKTRVCRGFVATKRRRGDVRSLIAKFGSNRKEYFSAVMQNGLEKEHDQLAELLMSHISTDIERSSSEGLPTYHGMPSALLEAVLDSTSLVETGEEPPDYANYILSLPLLGSRIQGFHAIGEASLIPPRNASLAEQSQSLVTPLQIPPVRFTKKGTLFIDEIIIQKLIREGSKLDGFTHFVRPRSRPSLNCYLLIPGDNCILLTSSIHADPTSPHGSTGICQEILSAADCELPVMLWDKRICLLHREKHVKADRAGVIHLINAINNEFGIKCTLDKGGRKYRRIHSGIRITLDGGSTV
jgi:hypothetical protein